MFLFGLAQFDSIQSSPGGGSIQRFEGEEPWCTREVPKESINTTTQSREGEALCQMTKTIILKQESVLGVSTGLLMACLAAPAAGRRKENKQCSEARSRAAKRERVRDWSTTVY